MLPEQMVMFATGIECSYPVILNGTHRVDELALTGHYERWREDLALVSDMGLKFLRYGFPYHLVNPSRGVYNWDFCDAVMNEMRTLGITPILDVCHFGLPDWLGNSFQNPDFPREFAEYARAVAGRYPWVRYWTPVNEIFVTAKFSALFGWWNEAKGDDTSYVTATKHLVQASLLAQKEITKIQPQAVFIHSESSERTHTVCGCPPTRERARWENQSRFLALDLLYGHQVRAEVYEYLLQNGVSREDYHWFMENGTCARCVMGNDYYVSNERMLKHDGSVQHVGEMWGWYGVTREYYDRYHLPLMHTETNLREEDGSVAWLWKQWQGLLKMRDEGIPVIGFTWYSLLDQVDWDTALREPNGNVNPVGLYDLNRQIRVVGTAYRELVQEFAALPIVPHSEFFGVV